MKSKIFNLDYSKLNINDPEQRKNLLGALKYYCAIPNQFVPREMEKIQAFVSAHKELQGAMSQIQAFATTGDFPATNLIQILEKYHVTNDFDNGYEQIFDVRDFTGTNESGFDIADVQSGLSFAKKLPGDKAFVYQMSGTKTRCYFDYYAGALGWHRGLFDDKEYWTIEDNAIEFRNKAYYKRASVFYALIEAISSAKDCCKWVPATCSVECGNARGDAAALNYAAQTILTNCMNKGYGLNPQTTQFIVLTPLGLRGRIRQALGYTNQAFQGSEKVIDYSFTQITSLMLTSQTRFYVILPKYKLKAGYRMDLTIFTDFDMLSYTDTAAGWMRYGGCIADTDQIECIDLTPESGECSGSGT